MSTPTIYEKARHFLVSPEFSEKRKAVHTIALASQIGTGICTGLGIMVSVSLLTSLAVLPAFLSASVGVVFYDACMISKNIAVITRDNETVGTALSCISPQWLTERVFEHTLFSGLWFTDLCVSCITMRPPEPTSTL